MVGMAAGRVNAGDSVMVEPVDGSAPFRDAMSNVEAVVGVDGGSGVLDSESDVVDGNTNFLVSV